MCGKYDFADCRTTGAALSPRGVRTALIRQDGGHLTDVSSVEPHGCWRDGLGGCVDKCVVRVGAQWNLVPDRAARTNPDSSAT